MAVTLEVDEHFLEPIPGFYFSQKPIGSREAAGVTGDRATSLPNSGTLPTFVTRVYSMLRPALGGSFAFCGLAEVLV